MNDEDWNLIPLAAHLNVNKVIAFCVATNPPVEFKTLASLEYESGFNVGMFPWLIAVPVW